MFLCPSLFNELLFGFRDFQRIVGESPIWTKIIGFVILTHLWWGINIFLVPKYFLWIRSITVKQYIIERSQRIQLLWFWGKNVRWTGPSSKYIFQIKNKNTWTTSPHYCWIWTGFVEQGLLPAFHSLLSRQYIQSHW